MNNTGLYFQLVVTRDSFYYTVRSNDVKVLKSRWNFVKTKTTTPGNNIYTVICGFCSHSAKPAWWYGKLCRSVVQGTHEVGTEYFFFVRVDFFNSHSEQCSNTCTHVCMAVLIRCVTCKRLFYFLGQRKVLSCEIYLPPLRPCFFHGGALVFFWTATKSLTFLNNFQVNLHFTRYAQGKYVIERKFMYL